MKVWVTGAEGMLGSEVTRLLSQRSIEYVATDREVDITDPAAVAEEWERHGRMEWVINCAAWTAVDAAEEHEEEAHRLNAEGPGVLSAEAARRGGAILHISTDYVFSGDASSPYRPEDRPAPRSAYGRTKLAGERAVADGNDAHVIMRTAWLYGVNGKNFVSTMLRLMNEREEIGVVADQYGLPTFAPDLAGAIVRIVESLRRPSLAAPGGDAGRSFGIYHYTNAGRTLKEERSGISWYDFAMQILSSGTEEGTISASCRVNQLTTREYPTPAHRPAYSVLDAERTVATFGVERPDWLSGLRRFLQTLNERGERS